MVGRVTGTRALFIVSFLVDSQRVLCYLCEGGFCNQNYFRTVRDCSRDWLGVDSIVDIFVKPFSLA